MVEMCCRSRCNVAKAYTISNIFLEVKVEVKADLANKATDSISTHQQKVGALLALLGTHSLPQPISSAYL